MIGIFFLAAVEGRKTPCRIFQPPRIPVFSRIRQAPAILAGKPALTEGVGVFCQADYELPP
jgi:hypothetical protein